MEIAANAPQDLRGRSMLITGFTAGIGRAAALALARRGAELTLVCRDRAKGERVLAEIEAAGGGVQRMLVGDLARLADVRRVAGEFLASGRPLHVLFDNAGVVMSSRRLTVDGFETTFAINHLGHFLLTALLLPRLRASAPARVVCTASDAHRFSGGRIRLDDLQAERSFSTFGTYGHSKLANLLFTRELARREAEAGSGVTAHCYHPGFVGSDFGKNNGLLGRVAMTLLRPFARSPQRGAETGVYLCAAPELPIASGGYYYDRRPHRPARAAQNDEDARGLWEASEQLLRPWLEDAAARARA